MNGRLPAAEELRLIVKQNGYCVGKLAVFVGLHVRTFERRFFEQFGSTPKAWILHERMELAAPLLIQGFSSKQVAVSLEYSCVSNFCRDFKRHFGLPPKEFVLARKEDRVVSEFDKQLSQIDKQRGLRTRAELKNYPTRSLG